MCPTSEVPLSAISDHHQSSDLFFLETRAQLANLLQKSYPHYTLLREARLDPGFDHLYHNDGNDHDCHPKHPPLIKFKNLQKFFKSPKQVTDPLASSLLSWRLANPQKPRSQRNRESSLDDGLWIARLTKHFIVSLATLVCVKNRSPNAQSYPAPIACATIALNASSISLS